MLHMIGKLFHYSQYNKHRKDLPAENTAVYIKVTVSFKTGKSLGFIAFTGYVAWRGLTTENKCVKAVEKI